MKSAQIDVDREVAVLQSMTTHELVDRYAQVFGEETRTRHKPYLIRRIAWRIQAIAEGDLSIRARRRAAELANDADIRRTPPKTMSLPAKSGPTIKADMPAAADSRLPTAGTAIIRKYKGRTLQVVVLPDGFEYGGTRYKSLSAIAKAITGSHCNGYRFFKLEASTNE
ncbi:MAG: DUF2924 domain-containing protein [Pirellulaceae bacterium]